MAARVIQAENKKPAVKREHFSMAEDKRCCGAGVCIIDAAGECWCGQRWDGETMSRAALEPPAEAATEVQPRTTKSDK